MTAKSRDFNTSNKTIKKATDLEIDESQRKALDFFNLVAGQVMIGNDLRWVDLRRFPQIALLTRANFLAVHAGRYVLDNDGNHREAAKWWLSHAERRQYDELVFDPGLFFKDNSDLRHKETKNGRTAWKLNLFTGWARKPKKVGSYALFQEHLEHNYCNGDPATLKTVLDWMAHLFQRPGKPIGWALAVVGDMGCGKSIVSDVLAEIIGSQYCPLFTTPESLLGKFNAPLGKCVLGRMEEAINPRDPRHVSTLKNLLSGGDVMLENKGLDPILVPNRANFIFTSNNPHFLTAGTQGERRYFAFRCGNGRQQDGAFFRAMKKQMEAGGYAKLLDDLLKRDISDVDFTSPPRTAVLSQQIRASLTGLERWWADCLEAGEFVFTRDPDTQEPLGWAEWGEAEADIVKARGKAGLQYGARAFQPLKAVVMESAVAYARDYAGRPPSPAQVGKFLTEQGAIGVRAKEGGARVQRYRLLPLDDCRAKFIQARPGLRLEDIGGDTKPNNVMFLTTAKAA